MSRRKKRWKGLAIAVSVVILAGGAVKAPTLEVMATNGGQNTQTSLEREDAGKASKSDTAKKVTTDTEKTDPETDGKTESDIPEDNSTDTDGAEVGGPSTADPDDGDDGTAQSPDPDSENQTNTERNPDSGNEDELSEVPGAGAGDGTGTPDPGDGDGTETPDPGDGGGTETPDPGDGDGTETPDPGDGDGTETPDPGDHTVNIDGSEVKFGDFDEIWTAVNGRTATIQLTENVSVKASSGAVCVLESGNITLDLNGHTLEYTYPSSRRSSGSPDLIEIRGGILTVKGEGTIKYNGSNTYSGSCLYATGSAVLNIEGGTFSSNVSAPVCIDGATLNISGGTFSAANSSGSAITVNNGTLDMSGGRVSLGNLTLNKSDDSMKAVLRKGSILSGIESKGNNPFSVSELLAEGCGFRSGNSAGPWVTDEDRLSGHSIRSVEVDEKPIRSLDLQVSPSLGGNTLAFSYDDVKTFTLTATPGGITSGNQPTYEWYRTYNGEKQSVDSTEAKCTFSNGDDAGSYVYHVGATVDGYTEWATWEVEITPLPDGKITNNGYRTEYTYGDFTAPSLNGSSSFSADPEVPDTADIRWTYKWYKGSEADKNAVSEPSDAGVYILKVEAADAPNYKAVGEFQVTITPRTVTPLIEGADTKVYDGTTEAKDVEVKLDNVVPGDGSGVGVKVASIAYNNANVRLANKITATGIELTGNKAGNYRLSSTQVSVEASITKARLVIQMNVSPNTQKVNRPVTVTVTALNSDNSPMDNNGLKAKDITLAVSGRNDEEAEHALTLTASGSQYGVFTAEYITDIKGDKTFTVGITGNANYEVSNVASDNTLTILEKTGTVIAITASESENVVYGDEVTYTAVVSKENEDDEDALSGNVQFYENEIADNNKIGSAQSIVMSGDKASITLDSSTLTAGEHKILAAFSGSTSFEDVSAETSTSVAKKQLTWDVSDLSASKPAGTAGEVTVYGELKLEGLLDEEDVTFKQPDVMTTNGLKSTEAGSYKVTVVSEDKEWVFDPEEPKNYELPENDPEITAKVNAVKELPNPPADTEDGKKFKLVMEEGISTVPEGLRNTSFNTPAKIEEELKRVLTQSGVFEKENTAVYDVVLQISEDEGNTWKVADYTNFPSAGLLVTLPYPGGTGRYTNNFAVAHMFSSSYFGKTSGQVELPAVRKTDNGMEFTVTGLSPIGLAWTGPTGAVNSAGGTSRVAGAATGDDSPIVLYACLAGGATLAIVIIAVVCVRRAKKKKKKKRR